MGTAKVAGVFTSNFHHRYPIVAGALLQTNPWPAAGLPDPASDAGLSPGQRFKERLLDVFRPGVTRGHAYRYAEDSARAVLEEQMRAPRQPTVEEMTAPPGSRDFSITGARSWRIDNADLDETLDQEATAAREAQKQAEHDREAAHAGAREEDEREGRQLWRGDDAT